MKTGLMLVILLVAGFSTSALAQVKSHEQLVNELVDVMGIREQAKATVDGVLAAVSDQSRDMFDRLVLADPGLSAAEREKQKAIARESYDRFMKAFTERVHQRLDIAKTVEEIAVTLYSKYFTDAELGDLIGFYRTPTGKKSMQVLPGLANESIRMAQDKMGPVLDKLVKELIEEEKQAVKSKTSPGR